MSSEKNCIQNIQVSLSKEEVKLAINSCQALSESHLVGSLSNIVDEIISKKANFEKLAKDYSTPLYAFDKNNLIKAMNQYKNAFLAAIPESNHYYAVKLNHEPLIMKTIFANGFYADVSSARELFLAKEAGATKFLFSGPGKTKKELLQALTAEVDLVVNIDSFSELSRLNQVCKEANIAKCNAGIRVTFDEHQEWGKFGIPLSRMPEFCLLLSKNPCVNLIGIQFHMSWNKDASTFKVAIEKLSEVLKSKEMSGYIPNIKFIDMGGGFRPYRSEGYFPEDTALGCIKKGLAELNGTDPEFTHPYYILDSIPIEDYASQIGQAVDKFLRPIKDFEYYTEPGRILVNSALHVLVSVVDVKSDSCVITDGGTNIVGFERFEFDYFPIVNISNPSSYERNVSVYGALCMPQDYWGLRIFSDKIHEGDLIVIPYQGALTYSTMSDFIKGKASVYEMPK